MTQQEIFLSKTKGLATNTDLSYQHQAKYSGSTINTYPMTGQNLNEARAASNYYVKSLGISRSLSTL